VPAAPSSYLVAQEAQRVLLLEDGIMFWKRFFGFTSDCLAIVLGCLIAAPFFLVLSAPFVGGL